MTLDHDDISKIVEETVDKVLERLGIDTSNPIAMQRDFSHVRAWRESTEVIKRKGFLAIVGVIVTGIAGALWLGIRDSLHLQ